jgi:putative addiction module component (TIGR02574 family)
MNALPPDLVGMTPEEKLDLIELLWDSIRETPMPVPEFHRDIIRERLDELRRNPEGGQTLDEFIASRARTS